jgi:hypothetical protein
VLLYRSKVIDNLTHRTSKTQHMNTPVSESVFVAALKDLVPLLRERRALGYNEVLSEDGPFIIWTIADTLDDSNVDERLTSLTEVLSLLGSPRSKAVVDDSDSLRGIVYYLSNLYENPLRPEDSEGELGEVLLNKIDVFNRKAQAIDDFCSSRR